MARDMDNHSSEALTPFTTGIPCAQQHGVVNVPNITDKWGLESDVQSHKQDIYKVRPPR